MQSHANRYKRYIVPVLSVQMDFYVRVFVRIYTYVAYSFIVHTILGILLLSNIVLLTENSKLCCSSASAMKNTPLKLSYVYQCIGCDSFHLQPIGRTVSKVCTRLISHSYDQ